MIIHWVVMMQNRFIIFVMLFVVGLFDVSQASAQRCDFDQEAIFKLRPAIGGSGAIWTGVFGEDEFQERFVDGFKIDAGHLIVVGDVAKPDVEVPVLSIARLDRRGRSVWAVQHDVAHLQEVLGVEAHGDGIVVLALVKAAETQARLWLGFFDAEGDFLSHRTIAAPKGDFVSGDFMALDGKAGFIVVAGQKPGKDLPMTSMFYRLNSKGHVISKRSYNPGSENGLNRVDRADAGEFLLSGYMRNARDRKVGWLIRIAMDGQIVWQRQYPRGVGSELVSAAVHGKDSVIYLAGNALPSTPEALAAGWVMKVDANNGEMVWERFFTSDVQYEARGVIAHDDGRLSVAFDAEPTLEGDYDAFELQDFARLLTLNRRGVIFNSAVHSFGKAGDVSRLMMGASGERVLIGDALVAYKPQPEQIEEGAMSEPHMKSSQQGWVVAGARLSAYEDPCMLKPMREF